MMITAASPAVRDAAGRALDDVPIDVGFARAVVEGAWRGELWADREVEPRAFHAVHSCGMSLVWGPDVAAVVGDVVGRIEGRAAAGRGEWLQVEPRWQDLTWDERLGSVPLERREAGPDGAPSPRAVRRTRLNFALDAAAFAARRPAPAAGIATRPATAADHAWPGSTVPADFWPDAAAFVEQGGGWVVEVDGEPAALAFAAFRTGEDVEIGIETLPAFRRRGLAARAAAAMIGDLLARGLTPVWSCREDNVASARLAEALGYAVTLRLPYYEVLVR